MVDGQRFWWSQMFEQRVGEGGSKVKDLTIEFLETVVIFASLRLFGDLIRDRSVLCFTDNNNTLGSVVKGASRSAPALPVLRGIWEDLAHLRVAVWFERVCSKSNPADAPSRGLAPLCGGERVEESAVCERRLMLSLAADPESFLLRRLERSSSCVV